MCGSVIEGVTRIEFCCPIGFPVNMLIKQVHGKLLAVQKQGSMLVKCRFMLLRPYSTKFSLQWHFNVTAMFQSYVYYCSTHLKLSRSVVIHLYFVYLTWGHSFQKRCNFVGRKRGNFAVNDESCTETC